MGRLPGLALGPNGISFAGLIEWLIARIRSPAAYFTR